MTDNMKTAIRQLHGCSRTAKEMRQDTRTLKALARVGIARCFVRGSKTFWMLTDEGASRYSELTA